MEQAGRLPIPPRLTGAAEVAVLDQAHVRAVKRVAELCVVQLPAPREARQAGEAGRREQGEANEFTGLTGHKRLARGGRQLRQERASSPPLT
jgi:hypothetical protein